MYVKYLLYLKTYLAERNFLHDSRLNLNTDLKALQKTSDRDAKYGSNEKHSIMMNPLLAYQFHLQILFH